MAKANSIKQYRESQLRMKVSYRNDPVNILIVGATGAGKSSTLNALIGKDTAKAGKGTDPETMTITRHRFNSFITLWDSPGLGDSLANDQKHSLMITEALKLTRRDKLTGKNIGVIDMVLVIIEGSSRDMGTTFRLLNDVIVPNFPANRIIVAVNQADIAMKGSHWNSKKPDGVLNYFLSDKARSVKERIKDSVGIKIKGTICFSAEYKWNLKGLLNLIIDHIPRSYRIIS